MKIKFLGMNIEIDWLITWLITALGMLLDQFVPGEKLSKEQKMLTRTADYMAKEWGIYLSEKSETDVDDVAIAKLLEFTIDTAVEGEFELPTVPPLE